MSEGYGDCVMLLLYWEGSVQVRMETSLFA